MRCCPSCGFPIDCQNLPAVRPKCDEDLVRAKARKPLVLAALRKHADRLGAVMEQDGDNPGAHVLRLR